MEDGQPIPLIINQNIQQGGPEQMLMDPNSNITSEITMYNSGKRALMLTGLEYLNNPNFQQATTSNSIRKKTLSQPKTPSTKKQRRVSIQATTTPVQGRLDETQLLDTPIHMTEEVAAWVVVVSPNKPPSEP